MSRFETRLAELAEGQQFCAIDDHLGFRMDFAQVARGRTVMTAKIEDFAMNPNGVVHGGFLSALADSAMGSCMFTLLAENERCTNLDLSIKFLRPSGTGKLTAVATVVKGGKTTSLLQAEITNEQGKLVARGESTFIRLAAQ